MFVCICNGYREAEISAVARSGVRCAQKAYAQLGQGPQCGECLSEAQALIDQEHSSPGLSAPYLERRAS